MILNDLNTMGAEHGCARTMELAGWPPGPDRATDPRE